MRPTFRPDLICSREEQQGVVFYRVDDPKSETNFRLYEIEYLIATKLDGTRSLEDVIQAVRSDYSFDISDADLQRFVSQLEAMGFLMRGAGVAETIRSPVVSDNANGQMLDSHTGEILVVPIDLEAPAADTAEMERLLRSALLHVKQGYIVHARDYFLAARELDPSDDRLNKLVSHLEIIGDASGPAEVEYLWDQARRLFPSIVSELGQVIDAKSGGPAAEPAAAQLSGKRNTARLPGEEDLRTRVMWTMLLLVVVLGGGALLYWLAREGGIFESPIIVQTTTLEATQIPIFYASSPAAVRPLKEKNLQFLERGRVGEIKVQKGAHVNQGDLIATLDLPPPQQKQIEVAKTTVASLKEAHEKAAERLTALNAEREKIESERDTATEKLKELQPKQLLNQGGVSKRDLEKWKRVKAAAMNKLKAHAKKEKAPKAAEAAAKKKLEAAQSRAEQLERKVAGRLLRAPFAGTIEEIKVKVGDSVAEKTPVVLLRDESEAILTFELATDVPFAAGGQAQISVDRGAPNRAKISDVKKTDGKSRIEVSIADPSGAFAMMEPAKFRLVKELLDPAFRVPMSSIAKSGDEKTHVYVIAQGRALARDIEVIESDAAQAVVRDVSGSLHNGDTLVVASTETGDVVPIGDGAFLKAASEVDAR
ncbi:MAG TPA: biotin/lipoyl-binding protein [Myxococcota bacterium]|nr:biotin/lipoyl-binding protein [Myxococcota bacterium]